MSTRLTLFAIMCIGALHWSEPTFAQEFICAADLNGDGSADRADEQAVCVDGGAGRVCPLQAQACTPGPLGLGVCPIDPSLPCVDSGTGTQMCSAVACVDPSTIPRTTVTPPHDGVGNNGPRDASGACLGQIVIFPGQAFRCREAGTQTAFHNCCTDNGSMDDTVGSSGGPSQTEEVAANVVPLYDILTNQCDGEDNEASFRRESHYCYSLGRYCAESWPVVGCVQHALMQCCFNSRLARIIHEQGRPQLSSFPNPEPFGDEENPVCRGFTIEEFQSLDFSKIDLSEYADELRTRTQGMIQDNARQNAAETLGGP